MKAVATGRAKLLSIRARIELGREVHERLVARGLTLTQAAHELDVKYWQASAVLREYRHRRRDYAVKMDSPEAFYKYERFG